MAKHIELTGRKFGRLSITGRADMARGHGREAWWIATCECGRTLTVRGHSLRSGRTGSCGCLQEEARPTANLKHGHSRNQIRSPEYSTWCGIISRCTNERNKDYPRYGARGISISDAWREDFSDFLKDVGKRPTPKHQIDRIDNDKGYEPGNVRWVTPTSQQRNRANLRLITFRGETKCMSEWAERLGISGQALSSRLKRWGPERALTETKHERFTKEKCR